MAAMVAAGGGDTASRRADRIGVRVADRQAREEAEVVVDADAVEMGGLARTSTRIPRVACRDPSRIRTRSTGTRLATSRKTCRCGDRVT